MKIKNKQKGITLIALVITIIVLLILAGVTINTLFNNGNVVDKAGEAKIETERGEMQDMLQLSVTNMYLEHHTSERKEEIKSFNDYFKTRDVFESNVDYNTEAYVIPEGDENYVYTENSEEYGTYVELKMYKSTGTKTVFTFRILLPDGKVTYVGAGDTAKIEKIEETPEGYFTYSTDGATITGFSAEGIEAFKDGKIKTLVIPKKHGETEITKIGRSAFEYISNNNIVIEKLVIQDNINIMEPYAFGYFKNMKELTIPISVNAANAAFVSCTGLIKLNITKGTGIGIDYVGGTSGNVCYQHLPWYISKENNIEVTLEEGIEKIGSNTFNGCTGLQLVKLPSTLKEIGLSSFAWCSKMQGKLDLPKGLTNIGGGAFNGCSGIIGELVIPNGVTQIKRDTFQNNNIEKLVIHDNVTMEPYAFGSCKNMKELTIPISVNAATAAFNSCTGLIKLNITKGTGIGIDYVTTTSGNVCYQNLPWYISKENNIEVTLEEGIEKIGNYMFCGCTGLQLVKFPSTLKEIGLSSFVGCSKMQGELDLPKGLTNIGEGAFNGCSGIIGELVIPNGVTQIKRDTFQNNNIEKLVIQDDMTMEPYAFGSCKNMKELTIPISVNAANAAFANCTGITKVNLTKGTGIGIDYVGGTSGNVCYQHLPWYISRNNNIKIIIDKEITKIGNYTFTGLTNATYYYKGDETEWASVDKSNNTITIQEYNYSE